ncbi:glycosyltransferase [Lichenicoccus roseus]|uniref:Glycosyltransferase n=2 Tax=Lichenicoccus roseus TaxID=2683649 RepID=A0A5R9J5F4_9PROT|nr:glycosyltransferase [Lichenicoccus roseus]
MLVLATLSLLVWLVLAFAHGRFWQGGPMLGPVPKSVRPVAGTWPAVCVVVPARDEAETIEDSIGSLLAQDYPGPYGVVLVDDRSGDGTGTLARALASPHLHVVEGAEPPAGWSGKLWAVAQGTAEVTRLMPDEPGAPDNTYILLADADIIHEPAHVATLVNKALRDDLDMVSEMVELNTASRAERALVPAFVYFFQLLYPFARVNRRDSKVAAAAGGTILIRRSALARIGGIESLRGALIDDVTLAQRVKRSGGAIWLGHSLLARSVRPYPHPADIWRMVARTAYVQLRHSPLLLLGTVLGMVLVWLVPPVAALFGEGWARLAGALAWAIATITFLPTLRRFELVPFWALLLPAVAAFYTLATIGSAVDHHRGRGVVWKQRAYRERTSPRS